MNTTTARLFLRFKSIISIWNVLTQRSTFSMEALTSCDMYVWVWVFMAVITAMVLCARSKDLVLSVSVHRLHVVYSTARFMGGVKRSSKTRETAALHGSTDIKFPVHIL